MKRKRTAQYDYNTKLKIIDYYGGHCNWPGCNIKEPAFLTTDHINNNGVLHRKEIGVGGHILYNWLVKNDFPPGFQILCWNHQHIKMLGFNGTKHTYTKIAIWGRKERYKLKLLVISHYGGKCACCGETNIDLLTIDHICGGGRKQFTKTGRGTHFYQWLKNNNFPLGHQVLCWNCNCGKFANGGVCPHKEV